MPRRGWHAAFATLCGALLALPAVHALDAPATPGVDAAAAEARYVEGAPSPGGTGRRYLGREIAHYMSHAGAPWLERAEREAEEAPERLIALLGLAPGMQVADIGAGTGYHARRIARRILPGGVVHAVDIQPEMLAELSRRLREEGIDNVLPVQGSEADPGLPEGAIDLALMVDVYHELGRPHEMIEAVLRALAPGGRLVLVEYRAEDPAVPMHPLHEMSAAQIRAEMAQHPLDFETQIDELPWQHVLVFRRRGP